MALSDRIPDLFGQLQAERERLDVLRVDARQSLAVIDEDIREVERMLKAGGAMPPSKRTPAAQQQRQGGGKSHASPKRVAEFLAAFRAEPERQWTAPELCVAIGKPASPTVYGALTELREAGMVRLAGVRPARGGRGQGTKQYQLMPGVTDADLAAFGIGEYPDAAIEHTQRQAGDGHKAGSRG